MLRSLLLLWLVTALGAGALSGCGRDLPPEPARVAVLMAGSARQAKVDGLEAGLRELGFIPGRDYILNTWNAGDDLERLPGLVAEMAAWGPAVLVAAGTVEAALLQPLATGQGLPLVLVGAGATREVGLVPDPRAPGLLVTGVENQLISLTPKRLELLRLLVPGARRVLVLYDPRLPASLAALAAAEAAAADLGLALDQVAVASRQDIQRIPGFQVDGILPLAGFLFEDATAELVALSRRLGAPLMGLEERQVAAGFLAAYGPPFRTQGFQAARLVAKVLHRVPAQEIPLEVPDQVELVVNPRVAAELGLTLGPVGMALARDVTAGGAAP